MPCQGFGNLDSEAVLPYYSGNKIKTGGWVMRADRVEVSWDSQKSQWLVRIVSGEEVLRRHLKLPNSTEEQALRAAALQTATDEGYEADASVVAIQKVRAAS